MLRANKIVATVHLIVAMLLLTIALRTWVVMGLVAPVVVSGSSMVPTLHGIYVSPECPRCDQMFDVGGEFAARSTFAACPRCGEKLVPLTALPFHPADWLWIDRSAYERRQPIRGEVVVAVCPHDAEQLCTKRVVGLPSEALQLRDGDVFIDDNLLRKTLAEQMVMRQQLHVADGVQPRWQTLEDAGWQWQEDCWQCQADGEEEHWLRYEHLQGQVVTDDSSFNVGVTRRLNLIRDFMLSAKLRMARGGALAIEINDDIFQCRVTIRPARNLVQLEVDGEVVEKVNLSERVCGRLLRGKTVELLCSNFDRQLLLGLDGVAELVVPLAEDKSPTAGVVKPVAVGSWGGRVSLAELTLWRDIYYEPLSHELVQLGDGEYYLLGDNAAISIDSRSWGPLPGRLLIGKPLKVR